MAVMIDPTKITNYRLSIAKTEEVILFWVCAAGKNGVTAARCLDRLLCAWRDKATNLVNDKPSPFDIVRYINQFGDLAGEMKKHGIGCYNAKAKTFVALAQKNLDLKNCSVEDLESIPGIGPKTARCFLIHSRKNQQYAGLDTHVKKYMKDLGYSIPNSISKKKYLEIESKFISLANHSGMKIADFDLMVWSCYSGHDKRQETLSFLRSMKIFAE